MTINPRIRPDQYVVRDSRGDCYVTTDQPPGTEVIQRGPDRIVLLAQLAALDFAADQIIRGMYDPR